MDVIVDMLNVYIFYNGYKLLMKVIGVGCLLMFVVGVFCVIEENLLFVVIVVIFLYGVVV